MRDCICPLTNLLCSSSGKLLETSTIQPFSANSAVQGTLPTMTSVSPPPAWNSVFNLSKYSCDSRAIARYATWSLPLFSSLNLSISLGLLPAKSGKVKTTLPELSPPPPQPIAPSTATPATPTPPSFKKSWRLNRFLRDVALRPARVCSLDTVLLSLTVASYHRRTQSSAGVALRDQPVTLPWREPHERRAKLNGRGQPANLYGVQR